MTTFESKMVETKASAHKAFAFLSDFNNFGTLMPPEITNWKSDKNQCSFTISGMADLSMNFGDCIENKLITMKAYGKNPFDYMLQVKIDSKSDEFIDLQILFQADLNPMIRMVASTPLTNFVNLLVDKLKEKLEE